MSVNKVTLVGYLGRDPEIKTFQNGDKVANANLATTEKWKNRQSGEVQEHTEWHRLVFGGRLADIAGQYLKKGSLVYIEGSIRTRKWQGQDGQDRYSTEIRVGELKMLGGRPGNGGGNSSGDYGGGGGGYSAPSPASAPAPAQAAAAHSNPSSDGFDDMDDDIPF